MKDGEQEERSGEQGGDINAIYWTLSYKQDLGTPDCWSFGSIVW
jgi:hypothetical protein